MPKQILIADTQETVCWAVSQALQESDLGVKEITALTPEKTLAALREYPDIRLAVVDCRMLRTGSEERFIRAGLARHWEGQGQPGPQGTSPITTQ